MTASSFQVDPDPRTCSFRTRPAPAMPKLPGDRLHHPGLARCRHPPNCVERLCISADGPHRDGHRCELWTSVGKERTERSRGTNHWCWLLTPGGLVTFDQRHSRGPPRMNGHFCGCAEPGAVVESWRGRGGDRGNADEVRHHWQAPETARTPWDGGIRWMDKDSIGRRGEPSASRLGCWAPRSSA
jgi:hypothetical protein